MRVRSIFSVKADGRYHLPGTEWDCHEDLAGELVEIGAVEILEAAASSRSLISSTVRSSKASSSAAGVEYPARARKAELLELLANLSADRR